MTATRRMRAPRPPLLFMSPSPIDAIRSPIELPIESLLITVGAKHVPAGEAHQISGRARPMDGAHQFGRALEPPPVRRLAKPDADRCDVHDHQIEKGAH